MNRRRFIRNTSLLGAGLAFNNSLASAFGGIADKPLKVAVIGCGDRGKGILSVLKTLPELFETVAVCDVLDFRLAEAAKLCSADVKRYKDHRKIVDDKSIDAGADCYASERSFFDCKGCPGRLETRVPRKNDDIFYF